MSVFQCAVSLRKPYEGETEAIERLQFFVESHQRELLTLAAQARLKLQGRCYGELANWFALQHRGHGACRTNTHYANMQYPLQAAHRREEATKKYVCCLTQQQIFAFQNV